MLFVRTIIANVIANIIKIKDFELALDILVERHENAIQMKKIANPTKKPKKAERENVRMNPNPIDIRIIDRSQPGK